MTALKSLPVLLTSGVKKPRENKASNPPFLLHFQLPNLCVRKLMFIDARLRVIRFFTSAHRVVGYVRKLCPQWRRQMIPRPDLVPVHHPPGSVEPPRLRVRIRPPALLDGTGRKRDIVDDVPRRIIITIRGAVSRIACRKIVVESVSLIVPRCQVVELVIPERLVEGRAHALEIWRPHVVL